VLGADRLDVVVDRNGDGTGECRRPLAAFLTSSMSLLRRLQELASSTARRLNERVRVPGTRDFGVVDFAKETFQHSGEDNLGAFAGNLTYNGLFALFPFLIFLVSLLGLFHATSLVDSMIQQFHQAVPAKVTTLLEVIAHGVTKNKSTGKFTVGAIVSLLVAIWGASGACRAVMNAMNVMYHVRETRPIWKQYLLSVALAVGATILFIGALVLVIFGPRIGSALADRVRLGAEFTSVWNVVQWPALLFFVLLAFALIYDFAPNVKLAFKLFTPGALVAVTIWLLFSLLFSLYVNNFGSFDRTYGTLAGLIILLLYMYYSAFIVLLGAEINQVLTLHSGE